MDEGYEMQTLEILIEENAFGVVRPVEVAADIPVAMLISTLVEELHLPKTDLFGKRLFYKLRQMPDGRIIPEETTLRSSGIQRGAKVAWRLFQGGDFRVQMVCGEVRRKNHAEHFSL